MSENVFYRRLAVISEPGSCCGCVCVACGGLPGSTCADVSVCVPQRAARGRSVGSGVSLLASRRRSVCVSLLASRRRCVCVQKCDVFVCFVFAGDTRTNSNMQNDAGEFVDLYVPRKW